jgi:hypothetical protein
VEYPVDVNRKVFHAFFHRLSLETEQGDGFLPFCRRAVYAVDREVGSIAISIIRGLSASDAV